MTYGLLQYLLVALVITLGLAKTPELPLCPTSVQFFPQQLPMHCRLPRQTADNDADNTKSVTFPSIFPNFPDQMKPVPMPVAPGVMPGMMPFPPGSFPGMPFPGMPFPGMSFPGSPPSGSRQPDIAHQEMPQQMPPPGMPPPAMLPGLPMPMPMGGPAPKLPVIVMPFYSRDPRPSKNKKKKKPFLYTDRRSDTDTDSDTDRDTLSETSSNTSSDKSSDTDGKSSSERGWWKYGRQGKRGKKRQRPGKKGRRGRKHRSRNLRRNFPRDDRNTELFTPVLQYVTKDGYVIFEKKITKGEAHNWLSVKPDEHNVNVGSSPLRGENQAGIQTNDEVEVFRETPHREVNEEDNETQKQREKATDHVKQMLNIEKIRHQKKQRRRTQ